MKNVIFKTSSKKDFYKALKELISKGLTEHYIIEEETFFLIGGSLKNLPKNLIFSAFHNELHEVDWDDQAKNFSPYYSSGLIKIPLEDFGFHSSEIITLYPGEGFGDLSHPTTLLMLQSMSKHLKCNQALDIGSGSGILTLASIKGLNIDTIGVELCPKALELSKKNAQVNSICSEIFLPSENLDTFASKADAVLINMIFKEQLPILNSFKKLNFSGLWIASGIRSDEYLSYLEALPFDSYEVIDKKEIDSWLAIIIKTTLKKNRLIFQISSPAS